MQTRALFIAGLAFLLLTAAGWGLLSLRSFPREISTSSIPGEILLAPPVTDTPTPVPPTPDLQATVQVALAATLTARPTDTPLRPTSTPTRTPTPRLTAAQPPSRTAPPGAPTMTRMPPRTIVLTMVPTLTRRPATAVVPTDTPPPTPSPYPTNTPKPPPTSSPQPTIVMVVTRTLGPAAEPSPVPLPTAVIETESPTKMELGCSDSIRVSLVQLAEQAYVPTIEVAGHTVVADTPIPVGTAGVPMAQAFGPDYEAYAVAHLAAAAFDVSPVSSEEQPLAQSRVTWEWNVVAENGGLQAVNLSMEVIWRPRDGGEAVQRQIWRTRLDVEVEKPFLRAGQLNVATVISGVTGTGLTIPWIYERFKGRAAKKSPAKATGRRSARRKR